MKAALAGLGLGLAATVSAAVPLCETRVELEPRAAFVGQQVVYRLTILRQQEVSSVRFADDLSFPSFRVEWLPGQTLDPGIRDVGGHALVVEERRALFPARAGLLEIPAARIECKSASGIIEAEVPATRLEVRELPRAAPSEVVGPVAMTAHLARDRIELGESVTLTVTLRGDGNLWDAPPPLGADLAIDGLDVHPRDPEIERSAARRLALTRVFAYDLVPRRAGAHAIPPLRVAWLDPATGRYETTSTAALRIEVDDAPSVVESAPAPAQPRARAGTPPSPSSRARFVLVAMLAIGAAAFFAWRNSRRTLPARAAVPQLAAALAASARGDRDAERAALAAALRAALAVQRPEARALAAEELVARTEGAERDAAEALLALDRARFTPADAPPPPDIARVRTLVASLSL